MCSWGLVLIRGLAWGIGFGAAIVASAVSVCAPIESVLLPGRKTCERSACVQAFSLGWRRNAAPGSGGAESVPPSSFLAAAGKQGNDSLKANHYLRVILCCALQARYY